VTDSSLPAAARVLVAEDETHLAQILCTFLRGRGHHVVCVGDGAAALQAVRREAFDVVLLDIVMPGVDGLDVLAQLRAQPDPPEAIVITGNGTVETAIAAMKLGAYDYMAKPYRMAEIDVLIRRALEKRLLARENRTLHSLLSRADAAFDVITQYAPFRAVLAMIERAASTDAPVHIIGESGTGKTLLAHAIHRMSGRAGPFVDADTTVLGEAALEVELFGREGSGASGPGARRAGLLELGATGTLFIDEVGMLSPRLQAKLARALQRGGFVRVGGTQQVAITARLVTSSTRDLGGPSRTGRFRQDLLERLHAVTVSLPPLRDRVVDIPLLARHFLSQLAGPSAPALRPDAIARMQEYSWPGNVRELRNVIERMVLLTRGGGHEIRAQDLPLVGGAAPAAPRAAAGSTITLGELEREHIKAVLVGANWHQGRAAQVLGISAKTLYRKIREYGLERPVPRRRSAPRS
jgi:two-component system response regulator AtoC